MIKKTGSGFKVVSESGKNLSAPDLTKAESHKRLAVVEHFKSQDARKKSLSTWAKRRSK